MTLTEMEHEYYDLAMDAARSTDIHLQRHGLKHLAKILQHQKETNSETDAQVDIALTKEQRAILNRSTFHIIGEKQ
jgi:hypothetical protein